jgi:acyl dehydratase
MAAALPEKIPFDDLRVGDARDLGSFSLTSAEIVEFAERYDPHPFHVDEEAAKATFFGGIVASGVHTFAMVSRLMTERYLADLAMTAGRAVRDFEMRAPVIPDEPVGVRCEVVRLEPHARRPDQGVVTFLTEATKPDGSVALRIRVETLIGRRAPGGCPSRTSDAAS